MYTMRKYQFRFPMTVLSIFLFLDLKSVQSAAGSDGRSDAWSADTGSTNGLAAGS